MCNLGNCIIFKVGIKKSMEEERKRKRKVDKMDDKGKRWVKSVGIKQHIIN